MPPDPIVTPDDRYYLDETHGLWLPIESSPPAESSIPAEHASARKEDTTEQRTESPLPHVLALAICGGLAALILLLADHVVPNPFGEVLAVVPVLFIDYAAGAIGRRKLELPRSLRDLGRMRTWLLSPLAYAVLLVIVADLEYTVLRPAGRNVVELGLVDILDGFGLGVLVGWRHTQRPVVTILESSYGAGLLGTIVNLAILGPRDFAKVHDGAPPLEVILVTGTVFAVLGYFGYLGMAGLRHVRPPRLLLSPDGRHVWDGATWRPIGADGRSYDDGRRQVTFTPRWAARKHDPKLRTRRNKPKTSRKRR